MTRTLEILSVSIGSSTRDHEFTSEKLGHRFHVRRIGTDGDKLKAIRIIREADGKVDAIGLGGADVFFRVGVRTWVHQDTKRLYDAAKTTPITDGADLKGTLERWAIKWVVKKRPGIFDNRNVLVMSGLDRWGASEVIGEYTNNFIFGDFMYAVKLPIALHSLKAVASVARWLLPILTNIPFEAIYPTGRRQETVRPIFQKPIKWADVILGDYHYIRRYAPSDLEGKIIVTNTVMESDEADLRNRGITTLITTTPEMDGRSFGANVLEAVFLAILNADGDKVAELTKSQLHDRYVNMILKSGIEPRVIDLAPVTGPDIPRFAFVVHPTSYEQLFIAPAFKPFKSLPQAPVEEYTAKVVPPMFLSKIHGIKTPAGKECVGYFYAVIATPKMMMRLPAEHFYRQMIQIGKMARSKGASVMGLGAFTSVIGDAGVTVAKGSPIPVTSGNSYTVWALYETVKDGASKLGIDMSHASVMVIGATGSIGKAVTRLIAEDVPELILVAPKAERLMELARMLESQAAKDNRKLKVKVATTVDELLPEADIVIASSSAGKGILDVMKLKPGALVCDVAMPPDVSREEAGKRDDILVIASGEIKVPGDVHLGLDLNLPKNVVYACLAETILLTLDERNESFTLGREIEPAKVREIGEIGKKHGFELAPIMAFGEEVSDEEIAAIRKRAGR